MEVQHGHGLSPWAPKPDPAAEKRDQRKRMLLFGMRYVLPGVIAFTGIVVMVAASDKEVGVEIGGMFLGAGIAVFLLNFFFRMGVAGDSERDKEQAAREYFDEHGHWPDEAPR
jgi:hypothetical protein